MMNDKGIGKLFSPYRMVRRKILMETKKQIGIPDLDKGESHNKDRKQHHNTGKGSCQALDTIKKSNNKNKYGKSQGGYSNTHGCT
ncbi:MAG: hypothetical protein BWY80_01470 [Firmicutes bacterium ADurb.Bin456]|nr:MAG: hypothetical protein BWY80_01470 [Firmicutes bacterium ADurb.Bin456]